MRRDRGFSLVELMITVAIVGILAAIAIPSWGAMVSKARQAEAKVSLIAIFDLERSYHGEHNTYGSLTDIGFVVEGTGRYGYIISPDSYRAPTPQGEVGADDKNPLAQANPNFFTTADDDDDDLPDDDDDGGSSQGYNVGNPHYGPSSFEVVAAGVISQAPTPYDLDIWSIDDYKQLENLNLGY